MSSGADVSRSDPGIDQFLQNWAAEFARSLAPFVGEYPKVNCSRARHLASVDIESVLWWRATLEGSNSFCVWVGAQESTWAQVGKLQWMRLLERVQRATAEALNPDLLQPIRCGEAQMVRTGPDTQSLYYAVMGIRMVHSELPALLFALEPAAREELRPKISVPVMTPMLESLLDLELPLSVALGRATLPIGEVLKITSGSVVQLHGHTGESVEILVHGTVVARGQVVANKGTYGVRIQQIISPMDRLKLCTGLAG